MMHFTPFGARDTASRPTPQRGAWQSLQPLAIAMLRKITPFGSRPGRRVQGFVLLLCVSTAPLSARAQQADPPHMADKESKRDILVTGQRPASSCTGQSSAQPVDYACLNGELKAAAANTAPPASSAADAITSQATTPSKVGTFSHTATGQRMGQNFGKSAQPYRPPAPVYTYPVRTAPPK